MLRAASIRGVIQSKANDHTRDPELVEREWDETVDGAWAVGKAPVALLSEFLQHVQDENVEQAELTAREILAVEPQNKLVQDLVDAMKQQQTLEDQLESEEESEQEDEEDESDASQEEEDNEEEEREDAPPEAESHHGGDEKEL